MCVYNELLHARPNWSVGSRRWMQNLQPAGLINGLTPPFASRYGRLLGCLARANELLRTREKIGKRAGVQLRTPIVSCSRNNRVISRRCQLVPHIIHPSPTHWTTARKKISTSIGQPATYDFLSRSQTMFREQESRKSLRHQFDFVAIAEESD